jgi:hypothetical protein
MNIKSKIDPNDDFVPVKMTRLGLPVADCPGVLPKSRLRRFRFLEMHLFNGGTKIYFILGVKKGRVWRVSVL